MTDRQRAVQRLQILAEASRVFAEAATDLPTAFVTISRYVAERVGDLCAIRLLSADGELFESPIGAWDPDPAVREYLATVPPVPTSQAVGPDLRTRQAPIVMVGVEASAIADRIAPAAQRHQIAQLGFHSVLLVPLKARGGLVGLISVGRRRGQTEQPYTDDDLKLLEDLADRAALVVSQWKGMEELRAERERLELLAQASQALMSAKLDRQDLLQALLRVVVPRFGDAASVAFLSADKERIEIPVWKHAEPAAHALLGQTIANAHLKRGEGFVGRLIERGESLLVSKVEPGSIQNAFQETFPIGSFVSVPLRTGRVTFGALSAMRSVSLPPFMPADEKLLREIADRAALALESSRLYADAQEAVRLRDEFLAIASHELRTPISTLVLQMDSFERAVGTGIAAQKLEKAQRQVGRLTKLIGDLLEVSRISQGRLSLQREQFDLSEAIVTVVEQHSIAAETAKCAIGVDVTPCVGSWDRLRIEQALANLLANAIKYGAGKPISIRLRADGGTAKISVRDSGIGIAPQDQKRIFARFERAVSSNLGGLGLGLYIANQFVTAHGGSIEVESELGVGTCFTVVLPMEIA